MLEIITGVAALCTTYGCLVVEQEHNVTVTICVTAIATHKEEMYNTEGSRTLTIFTGPCHEA